MSSDYIFRGVWAVGIFCLLLFSSLSNISRANEQELNEINITYQFNHPKMDRISIEEITYDEIIIDDAPCSGEPGMPSLPVKGAYILLPPKTKLDKIYAKGNRNYLGDNYYIKPCPRPIPISDSNEISIPIPDKETYSSNQVYPENIFYEVETYFCRGYQILVLMLNPVEYIPVSGELYYYTDISLTITLETDNYLSPNLRNSIDDQIYVSNKVDNPEIVKEYSDLNHNNLNFDDYDLLILTSDAFSSGFEPLKDAHDQIGQPTIIKTLSDVGSSNLEDIRNYIKDAYMNWGIDYVLIGGDDNIVPAPILWVYGLDEGSDPYETYMPSDLYYACLDGPYNYDGDDKWGEPTDGDGGGDVDLYAEVFVGRACVGSIDEVANFVSKTIDYLSRDPEDPYLAKYCLAGEYMGDYGIASWAGNYCDQLIDECTDDGYTTYGIPSDKYEITKLYDRDWPGNDWPKSEIMNIINDGVHFINHLGHSSYDYNMKMESSDVLTLTNEDPCFIYSQGCMAGGFDNGDCIAEYFTVKTDKAAFAVIMNARYGWFWSYSTDGDSQRFNRQYMDALFNERIPEIGKANQDSKEDNIEIIERSCIRWCYYELNLFGDPMLSIYEASDHPRLEVKDVEDGIGLTIEILNSGTQDAIDISWTVTINGGLICLNRENTGLIDSLAINETKNIKIMTFGIGLGYISESPTLTIFAEAPGTNSIQKVMSVKILGPFVKIQQ